MSDTTASKTGSSNQKSQVFITTYALIMMNVAILAGLGNDVQQAFYGLSSVTLFAIGALVFFIPTGLVAAELAGGWPGRGGIFRWVGEGMGKGWGFMCLLILWFQTTFSFGASMPSSAATIGFFTPDYDWAVKFADNPKYELPIMCGFILYFWVVTWLCTRGAKVFSGIAKYGVTIGTIIPLAVIIILMFVWLFQGHKSAIEFTPSGLIPKWNGMTTLALAAGVFTSYAGIDMNAAHIKQLKRPKTQFPIAMLAAGIISFIIFVVGTIIIAVVIPEKDINVIYGLNTLYHELGKTIGIPWLYMIFVYVGLLAGLALLLTNLAGPSFMLGQAARSGFLPKKIQSHNKYGMPSRMLYFQAACITVIAFIVKLLPNVEGFVVMMSQAITVLYMIYYVVMFIAFLRLRYNQPNRPRSFKVPGGQFGAWLVAIVGLASSIFGIVLAIYPPEQIKKEVGSGLVYAITIVILVLIIMAVSFGLYLLSKRHSDWVDKNNLFAPFTWEIEGFKKPKKVLSNIPTEIMTASQNPMGMPIKIPFNPNETLADYDKRVGTSTSSNTVVNNPTDGATTSASVAPNTPPPSNKVANNQTISDTKTTTTSGSTSVSAESTKSVGKTSESAGKQQDKVAVVEKPKTSSEASDNTTQNKK